MKLLTFVANPVMAAPWRGGSHQLGFSSSAAHSRPPVGETPTAPCGRQALDPTDDAAAEPAAGETPAAVLPVLPLPVGLALSLEVECIAECLYRANAIRMGDGKPPIVFDRLSSDVRAAYRDAAIVAVQRIDPHVHADAVGTAAAVVPGFADALHVYTTALQYGTGRGPMNALQELLALIDLVRGQHRAGITPPFGQVERLFDLAADVRSAVALESTVTDLQRRTAAFVEKPVADVSVSPTVTVRIVLEDARG